jgi:hypothetical protein
MELAMWRLVAGPMHVIHAADQFGPVANAASCDVTAPKRALLLESAPTSTIIQLWCSTASWLPNQILLSALRT